MALRITKVYLHAIHEFNISLQVLPCSEIVNNPKLCIAA